MIDRSFWKNRKVFITGHTGFKGSWLTQWLVSLGADVCGYALSPPSQPNLFTTLRLDDEIKSVIGDVRNLESLRTSIQRFKPEILFHLAAQPLVRLSYSEPLMTYDTNIMGALNVYEAVRKCESLYAIVSITTDKCYENREWVWGYRENDPMGGHDPYSSSKACVELISTAYRRSFFNPDLYGVAHHVALATARAGNVIGGGDWALDRLFPDCIRSLSTDQPIQIRNPKSTRPWQLVLEPLYGYLLLAQRLLENGKEFCEGWNFGPGDAGIMDVETVVREIVQAWGSGEYRFAADAGPHEARLLKLDISKAVARLDWKPLYSISEAVKLTTEWYAEYYRHPEKVKCLTLNQIKGFESRIGVI